MSTKAKWCALAGAIALGLLPTVVFADGIEVLAPDRPFYPMGHQTLVRYRFTEPYSAYPTHVRIFLHHESESMAAMAELWNWRVGESATVDDHGVVTVPVTIPEGIDPGDDYMITVIVSSDLWGTIGPFDITTHIGDAGDWGVGGDAILLTYPRGGESWQRTMQYSIAWLVHGFGFDDNPMPDARFEIEVLRSGMGLVRFRPPDHGWNRLQCDRNTNRCWSSWRIPDEPERFDGNEITIRINARSRDGSEHSAESRRLSIRPGGIYLEEPDRQWPALIDPDGSHGAEETLAISRDLSIRWHVKPHSLGAVPTTISLLDSAGAVERELSHGSTDDSGVGQWSWEIGKPEGFPASLTASPGSGYRIRVEREADPSIYDDSTPFTIVAPTISTETPRRTPDGLLTSNEFFNDENMDIEWTTDHLLESQRVDVVATIENHGCAGTHAVGTDQLVATEVPATSGHVSWEIGSAIASAPYTPWPRFASSDCYPLFLRLKVSLRGYENHVFGEAPETIKVRER